MAACASKTFDIKAAIKNQVRLATTGNYRATLFTAMRCLWKCVCTTAPASKVLIIDISASSMVTSVTAEMHSNLAAARYQNGSAISLALATLLRLAAQMSASMSMYVL
jgi:hypothetical protein